MIKYLVLFAVLATGFARAFIYADKNKDGLISDDEYQAWYSVIMNLHKASVMMYFTGLIDLENFVEALQMYDMYFLKYNIEGIQGFAYDPEDTAENADVNGDWLIDAAEFDKWYADHSSFTGGLLKTAMTVNGQITEDSFINTLETTGDLLSRNSK
ncbi:uncharacterized protein [Apostichopus japonicus]|uniref:uncharacterized protein isoform X2 n=1 Tax=Stichopus japonicus TaxID=307972 RepID=UPI003AB48F9D